MSDIKLPAIGQIKGKLRINLKGEEKLMIVEFITALNEGKLIKGESTLRKFAEMIAYLGKKLDEANVVLDAEMAHILWMFMVEKMGVIPDEYILEFREIAERLADSLDKAS